MATMVEDVVAYLAGQGHGVEGQSLFRDGMPEANSDELAIAVISTPGAPSTGQFGSSALKYEFPRAAVWVRGPKDDAAAARTKAYAVYQVLGAVQTQVVNGTLYHFLRMLQPPFKLKEDGKGRPIFAFNIEADKEIG